MSTPTPALLPATNADGLPVVPMTDEQKYIFDLKGWILLPALLSEEQLVPVRKHIVSHLREPGSLPPHLRFQFAGAAESLIDHPAIVGVLNEIISHQPVATEDCYGFRYDHTYTQHRPHGDDRFSPHGGGGYFSFVGNSHLYQMLPGKVNAGLGRVVFELNPVRHGKGGTLLLSGSHKTAFPRPESVSGRDSKLWETYECPAGSVLVFTEALCHSASRWDNADNDRLALFTCYNTVGAKWANNAPPREVVRAMKPKRQTLFRGVWTGMPPDKNLNTYADEANVAV